MKKNPCCLALFLLFFLTAYNDCLHSINNLRLPDIRSMGMGGNGVTQSVLFNPALLTEINNKKIHLQYYNRYGLSELGTISGGFIYPSEYLSAGIHVSSFGYDAYRENMFRLSLGKQLSGKFGIGIAVQYFFLQTEIYSDKHFSRLSTDIGITYTPVENLLTGISLMNAPSVPMGNKIADFHSYADYSLQVGLNWKIIDNILLTGTLETNRYTSLVGNIGMECTLFNAFCPRVGIRTKPFVPSFGLGYTCSYFTVDTVINRDIVLGISMGIGLTVTF